MIEFMLAGASAVSIGTMSLVDPVVSVNCIGALEQYLHSEGYNDVKDIIGLAHR
jgi:dihydroorotate dehydrogenase (NAD+) catalytic subunit